MPREEMRGKLRNIFAPQSKGWHVNVDTTEPVVKVGAEHPACHELGQGTVSGNDDAGIDPLHPCATHALHRHVLYGTQELGLRR